jgi:hypothetical protein
MLELEKEVFKLRDNIDKERVSREIEGEGLRIRERQRMIEDREELKHVV